MVNDFTGGGQIFLHKVRMFFQVLKRSFTTSLAISIIILIVASYKPALNLDWQAAYSYTKAGFVDRFDNATKSLKQTLNPRSTIYATQITAHTKDGIYARNIYPRKIIYTPYFENSYQNIIHFLLTRAAILFVLLTITMIAVYIAWSKFGQGVKEDKHISGTDIKTADAVKSLLKQQKLLGNFYVGKMPIIKDSETKHFLVTGSTGSGKTNLINNLAPQIAQNRHPAIVIDQTGEMISKYYDPLRGDIIFNPLDDRSHSWDFWTDNEDNHGSTSRLEKLAKVLFKYGKRKNNHGDPFWDNSAEVIFCSCAKYLIRTENKSITELQKMLSSFSRKELYDLLVGTDAERYLTADNKTTGNSILSVLATNTKPLKLLFDSEKKFSLKQYFKEIDSGSKA